MRHRRQPCPWSLGQSRGLDSGSRACPLCSWAWNTSFEGWIWIHYLSKLLSDNLALLKDRFTTKSTYSKLQEWQTVPNHTLNIRLPVQALRGPASWRKTLGSGRSLGYVCQRPESRMNHLHSAFGLSLVTGSLFFQFLVVVGICHELNSEWYAQRPALLGMQMVYKFIGGETLKKTGSFICL